MTNSIICYCKNVDKETIVKAITAGADSLKKVQQMTGACTGGQCGQLNPKKTCCSADIEELIRQYGNPGLSAPPPGCCG
ncbi:MAG TPA: (2Fe-2S)-binding protein [Candidatus Rifleibacterium sp.]|nr:(2Fe-2S)-binding protein [Candidatus Rifleibacterium sp.]HPT45714.1 (2Fe-2S)-binding protein [Candidatus Rifleibacterium sp.]